MNDLRITETFFSIQGESTYVGCPTFFIRLTGCPLRCSYCDTAYAFHGGTSISIRDLIQQVQASGASYVCVTGGEPLAQPKAKNLISKLCHLGYQVSLETSGALSLRDIDSRVKKVMDLKTPGSGEVAKNDYNNLAYLSAEDEVKFVICDRLDYEWAKNKMIELSMSEQPYKLLMSPEFQHLSPKVLVEWILEDRLPVRFQMQLHKAIWGDKAGH